ncbi:hypothetical protein AB0F17_41000 [Nonomuraea sp. NPDC026600]
MAGTPLSKARTGVTCTRRCAQTLLGKAAVLLERITDGCRIYRVHLQMVA